MTPKIVWTDDVLNFIIKYVQATPYIWNPSNLNFNNKRRKAKFWDDLAKKINSYEEFSSKNPHLTRDVLSRKWNNMKSYYVAERHRLFTLNRGENLDDNDDADVDTIAWKFMPAMSFLNTRGSRSGRKELKTDPSFANEANPSDGSFELSEDDFEQSLDPLEAAKSMLEVATEAPTAVSPSTRRTPEITNEIFHFVSNTEDDEDEQSSSSIKEQEVAAPGHLMPTLSSQLPTNSCYHYAMIIAQDLDQLDEDLKIDAKLEIMQVLAKYKKEHLRSKRNRVIVKREPA
ncbi:uncharacterized protein LOC111518770 [Drosophila willistoni]|uniref:uncharacterized protein LOC111518770 n=1 Tax=Drosophila willistoni TaxID=7260 RepID=UPI000C26C4D9|nr:uncharacterized protein LOC111518770 [Drosophila willistoni]